MKDVTSMKSLKDVIRAFEEGEISDVEALQMIINEAMQMLQKLEEV